MEMETVLRQNSSSTGSVDTQSSDPSGTSNNQSSSSADVGSSSGVGTHGAILSTKGAFNGSGISVLSSQFSNISSPSPEDDESNLLVFFQHHSGEIRWMKQTGADAWDGGSGNEVAASDARNGTPISAMSARPDGVRQWHVFCMIIYLRRRGNSRQSARLTSS